jgi:hypothetical protein
MNQMQTMTKNYGIKAVGRAAAATVMLPLAIGVDLVILPGPQVRDVLCCALLCCAVLPWLCCGVVCWIRLCCLVFCGPRHRA